MPREAAGRYRLATGAQVLPENIFPLDPGAREEIAPGTVCPILGQEAWVSAEGRLNPCCAPDAQRRALGDLGALHEHSLTAIWQSVGYRTLVGTYREHPLCRGCNMRRPEPYEPPLARIDHRH